MRTTLRLLPVSTAINAVSNEDGWAALSQVGGYLTKNDSSFDARNYGFGKLSKLVRSLKYIEVQEKAIENSTGVHLYIRLKAGPEAGR